MGFCSFSLDLDGIIGVTLLSSNLISFKLFNSPLSRLMHSFNLKIKN